MKRTQIQLEEQTYETLRHQAYERGCSISALVRDMLAHSLGAPSPRRRLTVKQFTFIGGGRSQQAKRAPVSERHDEALADAVRNAPRP